MGGEIRRSIDGVFCCSNGVKVFVNFSAGGGGNVFEIARSGVSHWGVEDLGCASLVARSCVLLTGAGNGKGDFPLSGIARQPASNAGRRKS
jgi:hypothetical protein